MYKYKKYVASFLLAFTVMLFSCVSVFAVGYKEYSNYYRYSYDEKENFDGSDYVFNMCPTYAFTLVSVVNGKLSGGFDDETRLEITSVQRYNGRIVQINFSILDDYRYIETIDYTTSNTRYEYKTNKKSSNFAPIYASYFENKTYGYTIDWSYISIPDGIIEAGEQFSYYDYFGNEKTIMFNGNGGIFGGASHNSFEEWEKAEFPDISNYIPDITDEKYQIRDIMEYLPEMPDSLDIVDWLKYLSSLFPSAFSWFWDNVRGISFYVVDLIKGFFNFISDFFKAFFENLKNVFVSLFDFSNVDVVGKIAERSAELRTLFELKFPILKTISEIGTAIETLEKDNSAIFSFPDVTFPLFNGKTLTISGFTVTFDIVKKIRVYTDPIIIGIVYLSTFLFFKNALPDMLGGVGGGVHQTGDSISQHIYEEQQKNRNKIGF